MNKGILDEIGYNRVRIDGRDLYNAGYTIEPLYILILQLLKDARKQHLIGADTKLAELQYLMTRGI